MIKAFLFLALIAAISLLFPAPEQFQRNYEIGTIWTHEDVIAPFSFAVYKDESEYRKEVHEAAANVKPVFDKINVAKYRTDSITSFIRSIQSALETELKMSRERNPKVLSLDSTKLRSQLTALPYQFNTSEWTQLFNHFYRQRSFFGKMNGLAEISSQIISQAYAQGIIDRPKNQLNSRLLAVRQGTLETSEPIDQVVTIDDLYSQLLQANLQLFEGDTTVAQILSHAISLQIIPNLSFNRTQTEREIQAAVDLVPRTVGYVKENERIVSKHDRITPDIKLKLDSLERALRERTGKTEMMLQFSGRFLMVFVIIGLFSLYIFLFRRKIFQNNKMLTLIAVLFLFEAILAYFAFTQQTSLPVEYLILTPVASMILAVVFDSRVAFQGTVAIALLIGAIKGNDFGAAFASLSAGALAVYTVRDMKNRTQIFRSLVFIFIGYSIATLAISFQRAEDSTRILANFSFIAINSILSPIITFGLLIFFERVFNIATDLTLLELSDFNQPLLKELSQKAPGTFHHSIIVGTLAEKAAEAIGANPILARVGAYYHDIGKTLKPEYFVENTMDPTKSKHDWLPPDISGQVVMSHVTDGIELAKKYRLPQRLIDFIPMHHGTTLVSYFYGKALRRPFATGDIHEEDFRYEGPKPNSKETAIVMLADSVEAATRSLADKTIENVEAMINAIVKSRYDEGQLDNADLTFKDLTKIKESFLNVLSGIYHKRIEYPDQERNQEELKQQINAEEVKELTQEDINALAPPLKKQVQTKSRKIKSNRKNQNPRKQN
ncbi:MAG: HD family phosphohydrolase [Candidatus Kryptoniota bacterium]